MTSPAIFRWLHRVGYVASLIVIAELMVWGPAALRRWQDSHRFATMMRESTRIHDIPIAAWTADTRFEDARLLTLLAKLPPLPTLAPDGLRFAALPFTGKRYFAIALAHRAGSVAGTMVSIDLDENWKMGSKVVTRHFTMPPSAYLAMSARADRLFDGWGGYSGRVFDGSTMAIERVHGTKVTSARGILAPYEKLGPLMREALAPYVPEVGRLEHDWAVPTPAPAQTPLSRVSIPAPAKLSGKAVQSADGRADSTPGWVADYPFGETAPENVVRRPSSARR